MRYLPLSDADRRQMLGQIGATSVDELYSDVPKSALNAKIELPPHRGELEVERIMGAMAAKNRAAGAGPFFVGCGAYKHHVPATVDHIIQRSEFLTSYTPYQPEIAQGTLQYLFEFQTQIAALTGMEVANASMYDGSTACAEAALMARRVTKRTKVMMSGALHPHYAAVTRTNCELLGDEVVQLPIDIDAKEDLAAAIDADASCVIVQTPDVFGNVRDITALVESVPGEGRPSRRGRDRNHVARRGQKPRRDGRRHRRRRGPVDRQRLDFRRALCRLFRDARKTDPPDARPLLRHDGRTPTASAASF